MSKYYDMLKDDRYGSSFEQRRERLFQKALEIDRSNRKKASRGVYGVILLLGLWMYIAGASGATQLVPYFMFALLFAGFYVGFHTGVEDKERLEFQSGLLRYRSEVK